MPLPPPASLGLPAKPGSAPPGPARSAPATSASTSGPTASPSPHCAICKSPAKYTCPRCSLRTCSLPCSKAHKEKKGCSGVRDPAAFVPLAKYTQGTWDGDYAWLEGARRQVAAFGAGIGAEEARGATGGDRGRGRGRGRGGTAGRGGAAAGRGRKPKTDGLRWALAQVGAEVDVLPEGMSRRRQNQSSWNPKTHTLAITLQLVPCGRLAVAPTDDDKTPTHMHTRVPVLPAPGATLSSLAPPNTPSDAVYAMPYHVPRRRAAELRAPGRGAYFPPLPASKGLDAALHGTAFVEFPVVQVWARDEWERMVRAGMVGVMPGLQPPKAEAEAEAEEEEKEGEREAKRPKVEAGPSALAGLGDYGDSEEEDDGEEGGDGEGGGEEGEEGGDVTLDPAMAEALGKALVADFGAVEDA